MSVVSGAVDFSVLLAGDGVCPCSLVQMGYEHEKVSDVMCIVTKRHTICC